MGAAARSNLLIMCCISGGPGAGMEHRGMPGSASGSPLLLLCLHRDPHPPAWWRQGQHYTWFTPPTHQHHQHQPVSSSCDCRLEPFAFGSTCSKINNIAKGSGFVLFILYIFLYWDGSLMYHVWDWSASLKWWTSSFLFFFTSSITFHLLILSPEGITASDHQ